MSEEYNKVFEDMGLRVRAYSYLDKNMPLRNILDLRLNINLQMGEITQDQFEGWFLGDLNICRKEIVFLDNQEENYHCYIIDETVPENMEHPKIDWEEWADEEGDFLLSSDFSEIEDAVAYFEERAKKRGYTK